MPRLRLLVLPLAVALAVCASPRPAAAHPLGNLTTNTYAGVVVAPDEVRVDYVLDLAELPTVQVRPDVEAGAGRWPAEECGRLASGLRVVVGDQPVGLAVRAADLELLPGQAGLETLRLTCDLTGPAAIGARDHVTVVDGNFTDRIGWRETTLRGDRVTLSGSDLPDTSVSNRLRSYPQNVRSPERRLEGTAQATAGGPRLTEAIDAAAGGPRHSEAVDAPAATRPQRRGADPLTAWFQDLVGRRDLTLGLAAAAAAIAIVLGGLHALAPGHGKTLMAATVVARRGTRRQVLTIGSTVALTHTGGVVALGTTIWVSQAVAPDQVLPWLTVASGVLLAVCGIALLVRRVVLGQHGHAHLRLRGLHPHDHGPHDHDHHDHGHDHGHHDHDHDHGHHDHGHHDRLGAPLRRRWLVAMGIAGGLVPTPSALVVLLGAMALGRTWFGVVLVALYGIGMAVTLMGAGLVLIRAQRWLERRWRDDRRWLLAVRVLPVLTAAVLVFGGVSIIARGAAAL